MKRSWDTKLYSVLSSIDDVVSPRSLFSSLWLGASEKDGIFVADPSVLRQKTNLRGSDAQFVFALATLQNKLVYLYENEKTIYGVISSFGKKGRSRLPAPPESVCEKSGYRYDCDDSSRELHISLSFTYSSKSKLEEVTRDTSTTSSKDHKDLNTYTSSIYNILNCNKRASVSAGFPPSCQGHAQRWLERMVISVSGAGMKLEPQKAVDQFLPALKEMAITDSGAFRRSVDAMLMDVEPWARVAREKTVKHLSRWLARGMSWEATPSSYEELHWEPLDGDEKEKISKGARAFLEGIMGDDNE